MSQLDDKINRYFEGLVVRKNLVKTVKGNAIVPSYVLEYLLGQYCATSDKETVESGIDTVKDILAKHYVHRNLAGYTRSTIREKGRHKVIDKISVSLNDKEDVYEATFSNLGINKVIVDPNTIKKHPKLLIGGVWCIVDVEYQHTDDTNVPWVLESLKPIQMSHFDFDSYLASREEFTTDEWIDTLIQSIGFNPEMFDRRNKLLQLVRLIPFCERNYNVIELGPKGTGKSHIYSEFSPHGMLISGGEITVPKLFVENRAPYKLGLVGYWDCVAFDEFAGKNKRIDKALVDIMKNYMANKSFSRGIETLGAEASMAFVGNTEHTVPHMLKNSDLFEALPEKYHDSAFLDRLHFYIPGWEFDIIRGEMFTEGYGFVVDYLAEVLRSQRNFDFSHLYSPMFTLSEDISTRDRDAIHKTISGLIKILYPHEKFTEDEMEEILTVAIEGRKRVKDQLTRIDKTYADVNFSYTSENGSEKTIQTREEQEYPDFYFHGSKQKDAPEEEADRIPDPTSGEMTSAKPSVQQPLEIFHGYELLHRLESAGMAEAFEAHDPRTNSTVFIKRVREHSADKVALEREIRIYEKLSRLAPQHVLQVLDIVRDDDHIGIVTEFADGGDLEDYVTQFDGGHGLTVGESRDIALDIVAGLKELHDGEIIHRDLKPRNILKQDSEWKIADFGISKNRSRLITQKTFQQRGTIGYAAPEQLQGVEAKPSADVYSIGKIFVFLLSGQTDVDRITYPDWSKLISRCLRHDPADRLSVESILNELEHIPV